MLTHWSSVFLALTHRHALTEVYNGVCRPSAIIAGAAIYPVMQSSFCNIFQGVSRHLASSPNWVFVVFYFRGLNQHPDFMARFVIEIRPHIAQHGHTTHEFTTSRKFIWRAHQVEQNTHQAPADNTYGDRSPNELQWHNLKTERQDSIPSGHYQDDMP